QVGRLEDMLSAALAAGGAFRNLRRDLQALARAGITAGDLGLVELNEAFAVQALAVVDALGLDEAVVNVNGGAIAIGHPLGCSGARIATTLVHEMRRRGPACRYGLATMCIGVGQGVATVFENVA
ncbi:MAG: hypothetical protein DYG90_12485, partial [Chloroflexi bacterium CFX6]|nr:hypothetical protein [Chloroflexi bacterium CFX6]